MRGTVERQRDRRGRGRLLLIAFLAALVAAGTALATYIGKQTARAVHPTRPDEEDALRRYPFAAAAEAVCFPSVDGVRLSGWFIPVPEASAATVILLEGYGQGRAGMLPHAEYLRRAGYHVLIFDYRGTGRSGGKAFTFGMQEAQDVRGAVTYLLTRPEVDPEQIAVLGVSFGAVIGLLAMAEDRRLRAIVAESSFATLMGMVQLNFRRYSRLPHVPFANVVVFIMEHWLGGRVAAVNPLGAIAALQQRPVLLIDDMLDRLTPPGSARRLLDAASGPTELWEVAGAGHAGGYWIQPAEYATRVVRFLTEHLAASAADGEAAVRAQ